MYCTGLLVLVMSFDDMPFTCVQAHGRNEAASRSSDHARRYCRARRTRISHDHRIPGSYSTNSPRATTRACSSAYHPTYPRTILISYNIPASARGSAPLTSDSSRPTPTPSQRSPWPYPRAHPNSHPALHRGRPKRPRGRCNHT